jgi:hypothetical protein
VTGIQKLAALMSGARVALGVGLTVAPSRAAGGWLGADSSRPATQVAIRALGARDAVIGAGGLMAATSGRGLRSWMAAAAVSDLADALASLAAGDSLPPRGRIGVVALASGAAVACAAVATASAD